MNSAEYYKLEKIDQQHWFYRGKRAIVRHWIARYVNLQRDDVLIDAGCGTGTLLKEMAGECRVIGLDDHAESIELSRPKIEPLGGQILQTTLDAVDLPSGSAAVVTLLDVLEHLDDDAGALAEMIRLVRPGGLIVITVPAMKFLFSDWDVVLHHRRRYTRSELMRLCDRPEIEVLRCSYFNTLVLPAVMAVRGWRQLFPLKPGAERLEDRVPAAPLNGMLYWQLVQTACSGWFRPPAGVSLLAVLRKKADSRAMPT